MAGMGADAAPASDMTTAEDPDAPTDADSIIDPFNDDVLSAGAASPAPLDAGDSMMSGVDQSDAGTDGMVTADPAPVDDGSGVGGPDPGSAPSAPDIAPEPAPMDDFDTQISAADQIETSTDTMFDDL
jgi:hypothetical protein